MAECTRREAEQAGSTPSSARIPSSPDTDNGHPPHVMDSESRNDRHKWTPRFQRIRGSARPSTLRFTHAYGIPVGVRKAGSSRLPSSSASTSSSPLYHARTSPVLPLPLLPLLVLLLLALLSVLP